jgi:hypothetical protein
MQFQHIYITNSEEIKEGDYRLNIQRDYYKKADKEGLVYYNKRNDVFKKIILTTDDQLIADGVQAIDDEFLEWFVKNPSCERVEVDKNWNYPLDKNWEYKIIIPQEEPKQETLEEAAEKQWGKLAIINDRAAVIAFIAGAKWQEEKMYSEKEVWSIIKMVSGLKDGGKTDTEISNYFHQFKKK